MNPLKELEDIADDVRRELDGQFRFIYPDSQVRAYLGDIKMQGCLDEFLEISRKKGLSKWDVNDQLNHLSTPDAGTCIYTGDVSAMDYAVFVGEISEKTPIILGEEITHGEHGTEHIRRLGSAEGYHKEFGPAAPELLGLLGTYIMIKKLSSDENPITLVFKGSKGAHWAGYTYAKRLIDSGKEIPYPDIFHAKNRQEIWDIIKGIIRL
jgi:hypothetical protein